MEGLGVEKPVVHSMYSRQRSPGAHSYLNEFGLVLIAVRENTQMGNHGMSQ